MFGPIFPRKALGGQRKRSLLGKTRVEGETDKHLLNSLCHRKAASKHIICLRSLCVHGLLTCDPCGVGSM
ncbi:hypothetical protein NC652_028983 [Populus alba x Populus x berolinensis]|nr:hypothetical protein NC652_028983 [Populus alba x Populus x berolinensis]